jgi:hypothetical protein
MVASIEAIICVGPKIFFLAAAFLSASPGYAQDVVADMALPSRATRFYGKHEAGGIYE